nr:zinc finger CCCH domain-containing protein 18-like [Saimiri boliviensis boliviensis]
MTLEAPWLALSLAPPPSPPRCTPSTPPVPKGSRISIPTHRRGRGPRWGKGRGWAEGADRCRGGLRQPGRQRRPAQSRAIAAPQASSQAVELEDCGGGGYGGCGGGCDGLWLRTWRPTRPAPSAASSVPASFSGSDSEAHARSCSPGLSRAHPAHAHSFLAGSGPPSSPQPAASQLRTRDALRPAPAPSPPGRLRGNPRPASTRLFRGSPRLLPATVQSDGARGTMPRRRAGRGPQSRRFGVGGGRESRSARSNGLRNSEPWP